MANRSLPTPLTWGGPSCVVAEVTAHPHDPRRPGMHLDKHTAPETDALVFTGLRGCPLRRSGWNKATGWPHVVASIGAEGLHFHDLRHTGNTLAADMGVSLKSLMARMGHDNERAALTYQHKSAAGDRKIAEGLNKLVTAEQGENDEGGEAGALVPVG